MVNAGLVTTACYGQKTKKHTVKRHQKPKHRKSNREHNSWVLQHDEHLVDCKSLTAQCLLWISAFRPAFTSAIVCGSQEGNIHEPRGPTACWGNGDECHECSTPPKRTTLWAHKWNSRVKLKWCQITELFQEQWRFSFWMQNIPVPG